MITIHPEEGRMYVADFMVKIYPIIDGTTGKIRGSPQPLGFILSIVLIFQPGCS